MRHSSVGRSFLVVLVVSVVMAGCADRSVESLAPSDTAVTSTTTSSTTESSSTALEVVRRFFEARDGWDGSGLQELFSLDAPIRWHGFDGTVGRAGPSSVSDLVRWSEFERALKWRWSLVECAAGSEDSVSFLCSYTSENSWTRALGWPPVEGEAIFRVSDGRIESLTEVVQAGAHGPIAGSFGQLNPVWETFIRWADRVSAGLGGRMTAPVNEFFPNNRAPILTDEVLEQWRVYAPRFAAVLDEERVVLGGSVGPDDVAEAFIDARNRRSAHATLVLLDPEVVVNEGDASFGEPVDLQSMPWFLDWLQIWNWTWTVRRCETSTPDADGSWPVSCSYRAENDYTRLFGEQPTDGTFQFLISSEGRIVRIDHGFSLGRVGEAFREWVERTDQDAESIMFRTDALPNLSSRSLDLWRQLWREFPATLAASGDTP
jgi:hypothetical protein